MDISAIIEKYDARVPRYTSYPTAPHFSPAVDAAVYGGWLAALPDDAVLSLYLHVPFCAQLCWYCGCHTTAVNKPEPVESYADTVLTEIDLVARGDRAEAAGEACALGRRHADGDAAEAAGRDHGPAARRASPSSPTPKSPSRSTRAPRPRTCSTGWSAWAATGPASACRISTRRCRKRSTASSPGRLTRGVRRCAARARHPLDQCRPDVRAAATRPPKAWPRRWAVRSTSVPTASRCSAMRMCPG